MNVLVNLLENAAPNAVIALLAVLYLQRQITLSSDRLRDKMDSDHRQLQKAVSELSERVARLEGAVPV